MGTHVYVCIFFIVIRYFKLRVIFVISIKYLRSQCTGEPTTVSPFHIDSPRISKIDEKKCTITIIFLKLGLGFWCDRILSVRRSKTYVRKRKMCFNVIFILHILAFLRPFFFLSKLHFPRLKRFFFTFFSSQWT